MRALLPLFKSIQTALEADGVLAQLMGGTTNVFQLEAGPRQAYPYLIIEPVSMIDWSAGDFDGDDIQFQVSAEFERGEGGSQRGLLDVGSVTERIRDVVANRDGFDLDDSPAQGESMVTDFLTGPMINRRSTGLRLVMCRYTSGAIVPSPDGAHISGVVTFRAFTGPN